MQSAAQVVPLQLPPFAQGAAMDWQLPLALHSSNVSCPAEQVVAPQLVRSGTRQLPDAVQVSVVQLAAFAVHSFFGSVPVVA